MSEIIDQLYELRSNFIVIGLTGRTGSGCSTVADLLSTETFEEFNAPIPTQGDNISNDDRKYRITYNYFNGTDNWKNFTVIRASDIITLFVLKHEYDHFLGYLREIRKNENLSLSEDFKAEYLKMYQDAKRTIDFIDKKTYKIDIDELFQNVSQVIVDQYGNSRNLVNLKSKLTEEHKKEFEFVLNFLNERLYTFSITLKKQLYGGEKNKSFSEYQLWGDNIREFGQALPKKDSKNKYKLSSLAEYMNSIIKIMRAYNNKFRQDKDDITRIVIDSLRNPYEILYFRERYSAFYTISINTEEEERQRRLYKIGFNDESIDKLDKKEYPDKDIFADVYSKQHIQRCIELSDIHIVNPYDKGEEKHYLKRQLVTYTSLMMHPGIVPPTPIERSMQIAYTAKLNSGCISRQVGASITDEKFSLKSIGWNNTPEGQTPCLMRNLEDLLTSNDKSAYSKYELSDRKFRNSLRNVQLELDKARYKEVLNGSNLSYCFKDMYNIIEK